jgi:hypothetical protein
MASSFTPCMGGKQNNARAPVVWVKDVARAHALALVKLLWPKDEAALELALRPWGPSGE